MRRGIAGCHEYSVAGGEVCQAFVPTPLPPRPSLILDIDLESRLDEANLALGRLDGMSVLMPDTSVLLYSYIRKEAVLSSRIEGTQSSLADLMLYEADGAPGVPVDDAREVSCYVSALEHGIDQLRRGMPICTRLMNEMHQRLMTHGRGMGKAPGEIRRTQNWIGARSAQEATFVPPPAHRVAQCLSDLERFINDQPERYPALRKAALTHLQFETIHPYLDGNGRLGRLLIPLMFVADGVLREPLLFLSLYFKANRGDYYELLQQVREHGDWEEWLWFFAGGVQVASTEAVNLAVSIMQLYTADGARIRREASRNEDALRVHHALFNRPVARRADITAFNEQDAASIDRGVAVLVDLGMIRRLCGTAGEPIFVYTAYLDLLNREDP